ncbi:MULTISPECIES: phage scaffolding protein [Lactobacillus]|uniref:phage scaffolding protein n=1 Tax=Lactobacillus TaxID=1578 RepID=UPI000CD80B3F|nr:MULTISPECIES: phage scaffolding protein [Lactobacillus]RVU73607.1 hypothetical protein EJK20_07340 [Lactobacillus xujianguonis]
MKREKLKSLGLNDDQINEIMDLNGADIEKAKSNADQVIEENKTLKEQMASRDKDLKKLQDQAKGNEDLLNQFKDLQKKYKTDTQALNKKVETVKLNSAVDQVLSANKVRNNKAIKALLNNDEIKFGEDGKLTGLDNQIKALKKSDPYLFNEGTKSDYEPSNGKEPKTLKKLNDMSLTERVELKQSDPDAYESLVKQSGY